MKIFKDNKLNDYSIYENQANNYEQKRFKGISGAWGHNLQVSIIESLEENWAGKTVLELGCGTGRITEKLASLGAVVTATDISNEMLKIAQKRLVSQEYDQTSHIRKMSIFDIDIDISKYELLIMINVLGRLSDPKTALELIGDRMAPESRFVFTFPCLTSVLFPFALYVNMRGKSILRDVTSRWFSPKAVERYCIEAGFEVIGWHGNHYVPMPTILFPTFPFFWMANKLLSTKHPRYCPSVFVDCRKI